MALNHQKRAKVTQGDVLRPRVKRHNTFNRPPPCHNPQLFEWSFDNIFDALSYETKNASESRLVTNHEPYLSSSNSIVNLGRAWQVWPPRQITRPLFSPSSATTPSTSSTTSPHSIPIIAQPPTTHTLPPLNNSDLDQFPIVYMPLMAYNMDARVYSL